jgi:hypothetical protein
MWINRKWLFALTHGTPALDWGEGMAQELISGAFFCYAADEYGRLLSDAELSALMPSGRVAEFNAEQAAIYPWPSQ